MDDDNFQSVHRLPNRTIQTPPMSPIKMPILADGAWEAEVPGPLHPHMLGDNEHNENEFGPDVTNFSIFMDCVGMTHLTWAHRMHQYKCRFVCFERSQRMVDF